MKKYLILFFVSFCLTNVLAQDPNWQVDVSNYQYSMTFTAFLNINGKTLSSSEDKVAALVNEEVRGVANVTYVSSLDKYVVYLSAFANTSGEIISFKIFNSTDETVYEVTETQNFEIDGNLGGIFQSYSIASPTLSNEALLNSFAFSGITSISKTITSNTVDIVLPANANIKNLNTEFSISNGANFFVNTAKQISETTENDFTNTVTYKLLSENEAVLVEYDVNVTLENSNIDAPEIELKTNANTIVNHAPVLINMETNVALSNFSIDDFSLTNAIVSSIKKENDLLHILEIVPIQQGEFSIEITENKVQNIESKGNLASNKLLFTYDLMSPYLLSIKRKNPSNEITINDTLEFTAVFSEAVENVFSTDFKSVDDATFTVEKENNSTYTIHVNNITNFIGAVSLNLKSTNKIQDKAGNLLLNSVINVHQN
ncbi:hypothetical protein [Polaribacter sp. SA4-12]|uniref:hypothetical protein n=1 Tax=Polaribacter sp. SA4-12 TaxID=1312072 RepID=UPI000B3D3F12|nr:hypothetical protein [Polaribacter sp. SA4-12]ARV16873.1 hypothetical protein BTO07_09255 [Polaribacter sp. SA4-12]